LTVGKFYYIINTMNAPGPAETNSSGYSLSTAERAHLPITSEHEQLLHDRFSALAADTKAYYDGQNPKEQSHPTPQQSTDLITHPAKVVGEPQTGTRVIRRFYDGTEQHNRVFRDRSSRSFLYLPPKIQGPDGSQVLLVTDQGSEGGKTYEMRLLPNEMTGAKGSSIYRWSQNGAVGEVPADQGGWGDAQAIKLSLWQDRDGQILSTPDLIYKRWQKHIEQQPKPNTLRTKWRTLIAAGTSAVDGFMNRHFPTN